MRCGLSNASELRRSYRSRRKSLAPALRDAAQQRVYACLDQYKRARKAGTVAAFVATNGELDLEPWFAPLSEHKTVALPVIQPAEEHSGMSFHRYQRGDILVRNRFGILEPEANAPSLRCKQIDLMLMPLVAFDDTGTRLGMGGGYYDRYLADRKKRPFLLGVAFACQQAAALPRNSWDVPLDAVVTEEGVLEFSHP